MEVPVELAKTIINEEIDQQIIVLRELDGEQRSFPIVIGMGEILAIDRRMKGIELPRPLTHDLLEQAIERMGGVVQKVIISDLRAMAIRLKLTAVRPTRLRYWPGLMFLFL
jgi:bifunctional DNase/RNase